MSTTDFTTCADVVREINSLQLHLKNTGGLNVSDVRDAAGHQYVDLVQEGGGVLGIALVGFTYVLEEVGIRFINLGGTSAGSINTALLGVVGEPHEAKSCRILEELINVDLMAFVDGGDDAIDLVNTISGDASVFELITSGLRQVDDFLIRKELGVNRGEVFLKWLKAVFERYDIRTTAALMERMNIIPEQLKQEFEDKYGRRLKARLSIIASDLTTQTKAEFPRMSDLYFADPENVNPAYYVRASTSIPLFFDPLIVECIPKGNTEEEKKAQVEKWQDINSAFHLGEIPDKVYLVDGGVMSNFPIDVFHLKGGKAPSRPTFGVKLGVDRRSLRKNNSIFQIAWNSFTAAQQMRDHDVILKNQDYIRLISNINVEDIDWINFSLPAADKVKLFKMGVTAACDFLKKFDWEGYKQLREKVSDVVVPYEREVEATAYTASIRPAAGGE
ncbi:patatin-like phospholipase family protein [Neolewinella antarctica]|uniref:NTE family protein n=1 Tax=Neolewinella antarctica TaxID=442734 RepID=A0ABX0XDV4_9BACT|nr:patatin-like phospholipase family protein [Neolewinella antarctica]NJC26988.1 NTE family protein [Neolewinella antarctica]